MYKRFWKRLIDTVLSLIALIILSPLLLVTALAVRLSSPGPVLFKQQRLGLHGKVFTIYKFRSMADGAEHTGSGVYSGKGDPRVTKVGKLIRATSIDELPQFINIIVGDMAIVGPRPPLPNEVDQYTDYDKQRLLVKPGCSGLWQATSRNAADFAEMVQLDIEYINRSSVFFDLWIIFKTIGVIFHPNGMYEE